MTTPHLSNRAQLTYDGISISQLGTATRVDEKLMKSINISHGVSLCPIISFSLSGD